MKKVLFIATLLLVAAPQMPLIAQEKKEKVHAVEDIFPELSLVNNVLYVKNAPIGSHLEIITIVGNKVQEITMKSHEAAIELTLPKAIYIFRIEGVVRKFIIK
jgi:hypothetical protein